MVQVEQEIDQVESWDPGGGGSLLPGIYEVKIISVEVQSSQSGHPKLNFKYQVVDGEHLGAFTFGDRSLHPNALSYFKGMLDVLNCYATGKAFDEQKLVGRFLKVQVIEYDKQNGEKGLKVEKLFKSDINHNDQLDITDNGGGGRAQAPAKPGRKWQWKREAEIAPRSATGREGDDLPF